MSDASSTIELEEFELVEAAPGTVLLRIAARTTRPPAGPPLALVVDAGHDRHRLRPLPAPPDSSGLLRVAFSAPSALTTGVSRFWLELTDGSLLPLPAPRRTRRIVRREPRSPPEGSSAVAELEEQRDDPQGQRTELLTLRQTAAEMAGQLDEAETRVQALADVVRRQTAEREAMAEQLAAARRAETVHLRAFEFSAQQRARMLDLADIAAAGSAVVARDERRGTPLSVEAITGVILVALGIIVALLILTGVIHT